MRARRAFRRGIGAPLCLVLGACAAPMQIFSSATDSAARITRLTWFMIILSTVVFVIVLGAMTVAVRRNRARSTDERGVDTTDRSERWIVIGGLVLPSLVLIAVFAVAETALGKYPEPKPSLTMYVTGRQWFWDVDYPSPDGAASVRVANEIHIPVGRPVRLVVTTADVIHSFWVPQLQGKIDLIPGDTNELRIVARRAGTYRGQCAEFCGAQHANMGMLVIADDSASFARWLANQAAEAVESTDSLAARGRRLFTGGTCATCHAIRGTAADARVGPDLTHAGSRLTIAAVTLPNTLGNLEGWIANAQAIKPDSKMPVSTQFTGEELRALAAYVSSLK